MQLYKLNLSIFLAKNQQHQLTNSIKETRPHFQNCEKTTLLQVYLQVQCVSQMKRGYRTRTGRREVLRLYDELKFLLCL